MAMRHHTPGCFADRQKPAKRRDLDGFAHGFRVEFGKWAVGASAGVVMHDIGFAEPLIRLREQSRDSGRLRNINGKDLSPDLAGQRRQLLDIARRQPDTKTGRCQSSRE
jgi:hypothetical protein